MLILFYFNEKTLYLHHNILNIFKFLQYEKISTLSLFIVAMATAAFAQPRAIGGRIGYGFEASYQHSMGESNMISVDLGLPGFNAIEAVATYDWLNQVV